AGRETRAASPALAGSLHLVDERIASALKDRLGIVPGAARARSLEAPVGEAIEILEDAVFVFEHSFFSGRRLARGRLAHVGGRRRFLGIRIGERRSAIVTAARARIERGISERARAANRRGKMPVDLRTRLHRLAVDKPV